MTSDLLARLESAPEGSRELDYALFKTTPDFREWDMNAKRESVLYEDGWTKEYKSNPNNILGPIKLSDRKEQAVNYYLCQLEESAPKYTTSLDAALPWERIVRSEYQETPDGDAEWVALHVPLGQPFASPDIKVFEGRGNTEILARRIAALKAREVIDKELEDG